MEKYRIIQIGFSFEVQRWGLVMLDGCPDYMWKTLAAFYNADEAQNYLNTYYK